MTSHQPLALVLRHGETEWSLSGQHTGRTDIPLTARGEERAAALSPRLEGRTFNLVLCSPLARARRTAELAGLTDVILEPDLMEWDYGEFEGRLTKDIRNQIPGWSIWEGPWLGGESIDQVAARADRVIARVRAMVPDGPPTEDPPANVALVAHGHILRVLAARWIDAAPQTGRSLVLGTGTISELGWEHETPAILSWNA